MQKLLKAAVIAAIASLALAGCSPTVDNKTVVLVTHDSFAISKTLQKQFETESGYKLKLVKAGDAGAMTNKLVLTKDQPIGDAVFGIDNTLTEVASDNQLIDGALAAIDFGDVCLNYDIDWFAKKNLATPANISALTSSKYKNLTVVSNPASSSSGMAFLATTIAVFGEEGYLGYWSKLKANGLKVVAGWEDAYFTEFSGSTGKGAYPIVLSYSSSPAYEVRTTGDYAGESQTASVLDGCFRQTEYVGVLKNAKNPDAAKKLALFLLNDPFQSTIPENMYMYTILSSVELPKAWREFAPSASNTYGDQLDISKNRLDWMSKWSEIVEVN